MTRLVLILLLTSALYAAPKPATPAEPATVIVDAFRMHQLVALAEGQHWNEQGHAFRMSLVRDPRFAKVVNDIVVESGSSRYQAVMDRFIAGEDVSYNELRHAWEDTTAPNFVFDMPIYEEFFRAVRDVNRALPAKQRLRVLLGDPPIDWSRVSKDEILKMMYERNAFAAGLVRKEVLAKHRRALLIYADGHLFRKGEETVPEWMIVKTKPEEPLVSQLEKTHRRTIFTIGAPTSADLTKYEPEVAKWRVPSIALLKGTTLGAAPFGPIYQLTGPEFNSIRLEDQFDALLYLGPPTSITLSKLSNSKCSDEKYMKMRIERMGMVPWGKYEIDGLKQMCGESTKENPLK
jgi:hypothetical protein